MELSELSSQQEASLFLSGLEEWQEGPQVLTYGAILICRKGKARLNVNYKDWELYEGAVITLFPNDVVELKVDGDFKSPETENGDCKSPQTANSFQAEILKYNPSLLREASLQLEQTVYSSLREDRCRQDTPVVTNIINGMFGLLKVYFDQSECTCISQLVLCQLKAFFIGFHEYLQRNPQYRPDEVKIVSRKRTVQSVYDAAGEGLQDIKGCELLCCPDEYLLEISHQHCESGDGAYPQDHHRPIRDSATQDAS